MSYFKDKIIEMTTKITKYDREWSTRKKGETRHHLSYDPEIIVFLPSKGCHLVITSFQSMKATKQNIKYLRNVLRAIRFILKQKRGECKKLQEEFNRSLIR